MVCNSHKHFQQTGVALGIYKRIYRMSLGAFNPEYLFNPVKNKKLNSVKESQVISGDI